jgi:hypothetical protein
MAVQEKGQGVMEKTQVKVEVEMEVEVLGDEFRHE